MKGIDVSSYQGTINWAEVKQEGVDFAILKIIRKDLQRDKRFEENVTQCNQNKIPIGVYNYSYATTVDKFKVDAQKVVEYLNGRKLQCKVWLDIEDVSQQKLGVTLIQGILSYQDIVEAAGYEFGVYTGWSFYKSYIKPYASRLSCPFWIARYYLGYQLLSFGFEPNIKFKPSVLHTLWGWQFSSSGRVNGIAGNIDMNKMYAEMEEESGNALYNPYFPKCEKSQSTIIGGLRSIGADTSYSYRAKIAARNGITLYVGSTNQNIKMLNMLKQGILLIP